MHLTPDSIYLPEFDHKKTSHNFEPKLSHPLQRQLEEQTTRFLKKVWNKTEMSLPAVGLSHPSRIRFNLICNQPCGFPEALKFLDGRTLICLQNCRHLWNIPQNKTCRSLSDFIQVKNWTARGSVVLCFIQYFTLLRTGWSLAILQCFEINKTSSFTLAWRFLRIHGASLQPANSELHINVLSLSMVMTIYSTVKKISNSEQWFYGELRVLCSAQVGKKFWTPIYQLVGVQCTPTFVATILQKRLAAT